jgi:hypothetical protein
MIKTKKTIMNKQPQIFNPPINVLYDERDVLVSKTVERHSELLKFNAPPFLLTYIWGELQSGKTDFIEILCEQIAKKYDFRVVVTTTLDDVMVNTQLTDRLKSANVLKIIDLKKYTSSEIKQKFQGATMFIVDEADFGQGEDSRFFDIVKKITSVDKMHLVMVGATNYTAMLAQFASEFNNANVEHLALKAANTYYGMHDMIANGNLIDINSGDYSIDKKTGKVSKGIKNMILKLNDEVPGFNLLRVSYQDTETSKSILLADKVVNDFQNDKQFKDFIIVKIYASKQRNLKNQFKDAQSWANLGKKVIAIVISGMRASISFWPELKEKNALRFGFEDASVASSGAQGVAGRFNGHYYTLDKNGKKKRLKPTFKVICDTELVNYYSEVWAQIKKGKISYIPDLSIGKKDTTHKRQKVTEKYPPLLAKLVWKGNWYSIPNKYDDSKYTTQYSKRKDFDVTDFNDKFTNCSTNQVIDISKILYNVTMEKTEYKQYAHIIYNKGRVKKEHNVMVFEIIDRNAANRKVKVLQKSIKGKDALSKVFNG